MVAAKDAIVIKYIISPYFSGPKMLARDNQKITEIEFPIIVGNPIIPTFFNPEIFFILSQFISLFT